MYVKSQQSLCYKADFEQIYGSEPKSHVPETTMRSACTSSDKYQTDDNYAKLYNLIDRITVIDIQLFYAVKFKGITYHLSTFQVINTLVSNIYKKLKYR